MSLSYFFYRYNTNNGDGSLGNYTVDDNSQGDTILWTSSKLVSTFALKEHQHNWSDINKEGSRLSDLEDVPDYENGKVLYVEDGQLTWKEIQVELPFKYVDEKTFYIENDTLYLKELPHVKSFIELTDTPETYVNYGGKLVAVKEDETGLEFIDKPDLSIYELKSNKVTQFSEEPSDEHYPSEKLVKESLDTKADKHHKHTPDDIVDLDQTIAQHPDVHANTEARHTHDNKNVLDIITDSGDGTRFLADDGTYKPVELNNTDKIVTKELDLILPEGTTTLYIEVVPASVSDNGHYNSSNTADRMFDKDIDYYGFGNNNSFPVVIEMRFQKPIEIVKYAMLRSPNQQGGWNTNNYSPKTWYWEASNDQQHWAKIDEKNNQLIPTNKTWKYFLIKKPGAYRFYRLVITDNVGGSSNWTNITEMKLFIKKTVNTSDLKYKLKTEIENSSLKLVAEYNDHQAVLANFPIEVD